MASLNSSVFMKKFREILRGLAIYIVLLCVLGVVGYFQFNNTDAFHLFQQPNGL